MKKIRECCFVLIAAALYGIMPALIKNAYNYGANGFNVTFYMAVLSVPVYLTIILVRRYPLTLPGKKIGQCVVAGLADMGTFLLLYLSYSYIPVGIATMLNFIYPVTVALAMHFLFGDKFGKMKIGALAVYLAGLMLLYGGDLSGSWQGFVLAIASGLSYTVHAVYLDKTGLSEENVYTVGLYKTIVVAVFTGIAGLAMNVPMVITGWGGWSSILVSTLLCRVVSGTLVLIGIRGLGAFLPSVLSTAEPVVALLTGWLLLGEIVSGVQGIGVALIMAAILLIVFSDWKGEKT